MYTKKDLILAQLMIEGYSIFDYEEGLLKLENGVEIRLDPEVTIEDLHVENNSINVNGYYFHESVLPENIEVLMGIDSKDYFTDMVVGAYITVKNQNSKVVIDKFGYIFQSIWVDDCPFDVNAELR